jgi:AcrR family transcriptional regulator
MSRRYELKRRAERQAKTRRRIVEAAVELHRTKGPARTTYSDVARRAGVQRHTLYRHFPDERSLLLACSGHVAAEMPLPDPTQWEGIAAPDQRLRRGLEELYAYFERAEDLLVRVLRDADYPPLREIAELRRLGPMARIRSALARGLPRRKRVLAALDVALDFQTWQTLARKNGLSRREAVEASVRSILGQ